MGKKSKPPKAPDYTKLAQQTAASQAQAAQKQTVANRPNQTDVYGNTSTWTQDPSGNWTQVQKLSAQNQALLGQQQQMRAGLMGQAAGSIGKPLDMSGLPAYGGFDPSKLQQVDTNIGANAGQMGQLSGQYGPMGQLAADYGPTGKFQENYGQLGTLQENYGPTGKLQENYGPMGQLQGAGQFNMDPMGNAKAIQDATYSLLAPQRQMALDSEIQRLKNQGLTEDSPAFQRAMMRQNQADTDAQLRSLLAGQQEYGNQFNRGLQQNQSNFGQNLNAADFANRSQNQLFGQDVTRANLANQLQNQLFGQDLSRAGLASSNQDQLFGQDVTRANLANQLQNQLFGQGMSRAQLADAQNQQRYQQDLGQANFYNQSQAQRFGQNEAQQRLAMALRGQQFGEQGAQAALNAGQRQQMLQEQLLGRQQPLNELQQLMQLNSYNNPQFGSFMGAGGTQGTDYLGAGQQQYSANLANYNASQARGNGLMGGLFGLAGSALGGPLGGALGGLFK